MHNLLHGVRENLKKKGQVRQYTNAESCTFMLWKFDLYIWTVKVLGAAGFYTHVGGRG